MSGPLEFKGLTNSVHLSTKIIIIPIGIDSVPQDSHLLTVNISSVVILTVIKISMWRLCIVEYLCLVLKRKM